MSQTSAMGSAIGQQSSERAVLQARCQTEHAGLIALFMNYQQRSDNALRQQCPVEEPAQSAGTGFKRVKRPDLEVQLAATHPAQRKELLKHKNQSKTNSQNIIAKFSKQKKSQTYKKKH